MSSHRRLVVGLTVATLMLSGCDLLAPLGADSAPEPPEPQTVTAEQPPEQPAPDEQPAPEAADPADATASAQTRGDAEQPRAEQPDTDPPPAAPDTPPAPAPDGAPHTNMVQPDVSDGLPTGSAGSAERLITPRDRTTRHNDGTGVFRTTCDFSHMNFDDPIVFPGQAGASHLHAYFGNTDVDADSTEQSIANSGNSTCHGGVANRSGYWVPALLDEQTGKPVTPDFAIVYYKSGYRGVDPGEVQAMPDGLRMVAGEARSTGPGDNEHGDWVCLGDSSLGGTKDHSPTIPTDCRDGDKLRMSVEFPQCWDGQNLDSADHRSHMAYAKGGCPDSHPVPLPVITMNVDYVVTDADLVDRWRLSSDMYDRGERGGASAHADWFNGWQSDVVDTWLDHCYTPAEDCGTNNLNDGTGLAKP